MSASPDLIANEKKTNIFKGTIAVSVIYGCLALGLLVVALLNEKFKTQLQTTMMPFLMTMIIGIIIIISVLVMLLFAYQPKIEREPLFKRSDCPDYWTARSVNGSGKNMIDTLNFLKSIDAQKTNVASMKISDTDLPSGVHDAVLGITRTSLTANASCVYASSIPLKALTTYTLSMYAKATTQSNTTVTVKISIIDAGDNTQLAITSDPGIGQVWKPVSVSYTTTEARNVSPKIELLGPASASEFFITGCQLEEGTTATAYDPFLDTTDPKQRIICIPPQNMSLRSAAAVQPEETLYASLSNLGYLPSTVSVAGSTPSSTSLSNIATNIPCPRVYPLMFAAADASANLDDTDISPNKIRCSFAQKCGLSWSAVCPNPM
jgi:hypothetical protein